MNIPFFWECECKSIYIKGFDGNDCKERFVYKI